MVQLPVDCLQHVECLEFEQAGRVVNHTKVFHLLVPLARSLRLLRLIMFLVFRVMQHIPLHLEGLLVKGNPNLIVLVPEKHILNLLKANLFLLGEDS